MALSIQYWSNYTRNCPKLVRKSENSVNSDHVLKFLFHSEAHHISAVIQASMRDRSYRVEIDLDASFGVSHSSCECPMGLHVCHHIAAALLFGYKKASKTDIKCSWLKNPKNKIIKSTLTMEDLFPPRRPNYRALNRIPNDDDLLYMYDELTKLGRYTAQQWLLSPEPLPSTMFVKNIEDLVFCEGFVSASSPISWLRKSLVLNPHEMSEITRLTSGQRSNPLWALARKYRLTASNFGSVIKAIDRSSYPPSLIKKLVSSYNLENVRSIAWGISHESTAIGEYSRKYAVAVKPTGLWMHESGVLGASPDGIVTHILEGNAIVPEIVEVKCPFKAKDMMIKEAAMTHTDFCLELNACSSRLQLKKNHDYYHQVQGQLHITGKKCCDLVVWTTKDMAVIRLTKDPEWTPNIMRLLDFYFNVYINTIIS